MKGLSILAVAALAALPRSAAAHPFHGSFTTLLFEDDALQVEVSFFLDDLDRAFRLDADADGRIVVEEMLERLDEIYGVVEEAVAVELDGRRLSLLRKDEEPLRRRIAATVPPEGFVVAEDDHVSLGLLFRNEGVRTPERVTVHLTLHERFGEGHRNLVKVVEAVASGHAQQHVIATSETPIHHFVTSASGARAGGEE